MLVLSRQLNEDLVFGEGPKAVRVRIVDIRRGKVRLGVIAPDDVRVDRAEVRERREADCHANRTRELCAGEGLA